MPYATFLIVCYHLLISICNFHSEFRDYRDKRENYNFLNTFMTNPRFRSTILFLSFVALFIFLQLFRLPFTPILFEGDHLVHMSNAWRMF